MRKVSRILLILAIGLLPTAPVVQAQDAGRSIPGTSTTWSAPAVIYDESWPDPLRFSLDDSAARLVALIPHSGSSDTSRDIVVTARTGGTWQAPTVVAQNGAYSEALYQTLPQQTQPVISGDGTAIAYVGYTGSTYGAYIVDRSPGGGWGSPALVPTGLGNTHYWISLSQNGGTLALCDYPFFGIQQVYVLTRGAGGWSTPLLIGDGGNPSLSADGKKLVYVRNGKVAFTELVDGAWTAPQTVTTNDPVKFFVEYPQMSGDGRAIYYWLVTLTPANGATVRTAQDLYILRRSGSGWDTPQKVNVVPILPSHVTEGPAAADRYATRLIYTRPVTMTYPGSDEAFVSGSHLEVSEGISAGWQTERLVATQGSGNYNKWPRLTPDGKTLVFDGGIRQQNGQPVYDALWETTTSAAPPFPEWAYSVTGIFDANGGSLFSAFDNIGYLFGAGTFSDTVTFTHSFRPPPPGPPPPPPGMTPIGGIGGIGGLGGSFAATMFGPGGLPVQPNRPVTVTVNYSSTDTGPAIPGSLNLWWLNTGNWTPVAGVDDPVSRVLTATVSHFSEFAIFGETNQVFLPSVTRQ